MKKWDCVLLDFDFTIADCSIGIVECFNQAFSCLGLPMCPEIEIFKTVGMSLPDAFFCLQKKNEPDTIRKFIELFHKSSKSIMVDCSEIYDGVVEFLQWANYSSKKVEKG